MQLHTQQYVVYLVAVEHVVGTLIVMVLSSLSGANMIFEVIIGAIVGGLCVLVGKLLLCRWDDESEIFRGSVKLEERVKKLELETRYIADQPPNTFSTSYDLQAYQTLYGRNWEEELHKNDVPITDVVKAIVKHLGMEIEKVEAKTVKTPQEVKVVEKPVTGMTIVGATGVVTMPDGSGITMPKPKRKPRRKTK